MFKRISIVSLLMTLTACGGGNINESSSSASSVASQSSSSTPISSSSAASSAPMVSRPMAFADCEGCHGNDGAGITGLAPELLHPVVDYSTWVVRNGRSGHPGYSLAMPAYDTNELTSQDLTDIFEWLSAAPKPTTGEGLYKDYCSNCHGDDGVGTTSHNAANTSLNELISNVRNGHHAGEFSRRTGYMPKWSESELSDAELGLIHNYMSSF